MDEIDDCALRLQLDEARRLLTEDNVNEYDRSAAEIMINELRACLDGGFAKELQGQYDVATERERADHEMARRLGGLPPLSIQPLALQSSKEGQPSSPRSVAGLKRAAEPAGAEASKGAPASSGPYSGKSVGLLSSPFSALKLQETPGADASERKASYFGAAPVAAKSERRDLPSVFGLGAMKDLYNQGKKPAGGKPPDSRVGSRTAAYLIERKPPAGKGNPWLEHDRPATCVVCDTVGYFYVELTCPEKCKFCEECIAKTFKTAAKDRSLIPVKCHKTKINQDYAELFLDEVELTRYQQCLRENEATNKMYCTNSACSGFIDLDLLAALGDINNRDNSFVCPHCFTTELCANCKTQAHAPLTCKAFSALPEDEREPSDIAVLELSKQEGWSRCGQCRSFVQISYGCNHMTCVCRYEFCYPCGKKWKTCTCERWYEERLVEAAHLQAGPQAGAAGVQRAVNQLRRREECEGHNWTRRTDRRGVFCDNCNFYMPCYLFRCNDCAMEVCYVCRFHRLD